MSIHEGFRPYSAAFATNYPPNGSLLGEWSRVFEERIRRLGRQAEDGLSSNDLVILQELAHAFTDARHQAFDAYWAELEVERQQRDLQQYTYAGYWVNVYEVDRCYGGSEEGGWWFDTGTPVASVQFNNREDAEAAAEAYREEFPRTDRRFSVLGGEDYNVVIEPHGAKAYPEEYPHYE